MKTEGSDWVTWSDGFKKLKAASGVLFLASVATVLLTVAAHCPLERIEHDSLIAPDASWKNSRRSPLVSVTAARAEPLRTVRCTESRVFDGCEGLAGILLTHQLVNEFFTLIHP